MTDTAQEQQASAAFSAQAPVFDRLDEENRIIGWMRGRVHREVLAYARAGDSMLELNCGTGIDACFFATQGLRVLATDNAPGMLAQLQQKVDAGGLHDRIRVRRCSFNHLSELGSTPQFDCVFSDFGGLNCADRLAEVLDALDALLKPGGRFTLVIMPRICLWELALVARGYFKTAFRRLRRGGVQARVEGVPFQCYYHDPRVIIRHFAGRYRLCSLKGLGVAVPPPYMEGFVERHPRLFRWLERWENRLWCQAPFNRWGDHFMLTMEKR